MDDISKCDKQARYDCYVHYRDKFEALDRVIAIQLRELDMKAQLSQNQYIHAHKELLHRVNDLHDFQITTESKASFKSVLIADGIALLALLTALSGMFIKLYIFFGGGG